MAHKVTGASLGSIYSRLNGAPTYHPLEADTFADWSVEAGDVVTVTRDGKSYASPVHSTTMKWKKGPEVTLSSTGQEKREPVAKMSQRKYSGGRSGLRNSANLYHYEVNQANLLYEVYDTEGRFSKLQVTVRGLYHEVYDTNGKFSKLQNTANGLYHEVYDTNGKFSKLQNTVRGLYHEVYDTTGKFSRLEHTAQGLYHEMYDADGTVSTLSQTSTGFETRISKVVDANGTIKAASITTAINGTESNATIQADHIVLDGNTTVKQLLTGDAVVALLKADGLMIKPQSGMGYISVAGCINAATATGNVLTLYNMRGEEVVSFSKAVSLSGGWNGTTAYRVTATMNGETVGTHNYSPPLELQGSGASSNFTAVIYELDSGSNKVNKKSIPGYLVLTNNGSSSYVDVNTKSDGTGSVVARKSVADVYTAGYAVTDSQISVTQGRFVGQNAGSVHSGATRLSGTNFGVPASNYGYVEFSVTAHGHTKWYYFSCDTR